MKILEGLGLIYVFCYLRFMAFERFLNHGCSYSPKISIRSNGQIGINKGTINRFSLNDYAFLDLYFDKENSLIGIKPLKEEVANAIPFQVRNENITISAKSFLEFYGIEYSKTQSFPVTWNEENGMFVIELKKAVSNETAF